MADKKKTEEITISLDSLGVPIAIIIAGIVIAIGIFFSNKKEATNLDNNDGAIAGQENETAPTTPEEPTEATTTIDDDPYLGNIKTATVAIVEFSDFQCSYCGRHATETVPSIVKEYIDTGKAIYVFRDYQMFGDLSETTAMVGECIADISIDQYKDFHEQAFSLGSIDDIYALAGKVGVDTDKIKTCVNNYDKSELENDFADGSAAGVSGTPAFVIGKLQEDGTVEGGFIAGAYPYETFAEMIDSYLE